MGTFPGGAPYGRGGNDTEFICTEPIVMDCLRAPRVKSAKETFRDVEGKCEIGGHRSQKQVENAKCRVKKADQKTFGPNPNITTHEFVQQVSLSKDKVPTIVLFTEEQIMDVNRFCCSVPVAHTTVLGFDKTFNLGELHVTVGVFKNLAVTRRDTGDHPIFTGPIFLHGNSDISSYHSFFAHLSTNFVAHHLRQF